MQNTFNKFELKTITIKGIELLPQAVGETNLYESLVFPAVLGDITIADWEGFDEIANVFAGDDIELLISTEDSTELKLKYKIYNCVNSVQVGKLYQPITYRFCSKWLIDGMSRQISKSWKDKYIHEVIKDLLTECGATIGFIEETKQKMNRFTTPLWTAVHSIHHLLTFAMNKQDVGGYVFWTDLLTDKVYCVTLDYLFKSTFGKATNKFMSLPQNQGYDSRIKELTVESNFDLIKSLKTGIYNNTHQGFNFDKKEEYQYDDDIDVMDHKHLATKLPFPELYTDEKYKTITGTYIFPSEDNLITDEKLFTDMVDGRAKTRAVRLMTDCFKVNILSNPLSSRRVGHTAEIEFQSEDKSSAKYNPHYTGTYLIRNIRHMIFNGVSQQAITFITDGYMTSDAPIVSW